MEEVVGEEAKWESDFHGLVCHAEVFRPYHTRNRKSPWAPNKEDLTVYKDVEFDLLVLFLAALGLCCCVQAFSSCSEQGLLSRCDVRASRCGGFSCCRAEALGRTGSVAAALEVSCLAARGILPDQGSNLCLLHWQEDS